MTIPLIPMDQMNWRAWGHGGPETLLIHCALANSGLWQGLVSGLGRRAVAPDLPGHGLTPDWTGGDSYDQCCIDTMARFLPKEPVNLIGHSFGAVVALELARRAPGRVRRLVLYEPVLFAAARGRALLDEYLDSLHPFAAALAQGDRAEAARYFFSIWGTGQDWGRMAPEHRAYIRDRIHLIAAQEPFLFEDSAGLTVEGALDRVSMPVLLLRGDRSPQITHAILDALSDRLADTRRKVITGAGHMGPITNPEHILPTLLPFLR